MYYNIYLLYNSSYIYIYIWLPNCVNDYQHVNNNTYIPNGTR